MIHRAALIWAQIDASRNGKRMKISEVRPGMVLKHGAAFGEEAVIAVGHIGRKNTLVGSAVVHIDPDDPQDWTVTWNDAKGQPHTEPLEKG